MIITLERIEKGARIYCTMDGNVPAVNGQQTQRTRLDSSGEIELQTTKGQEKWNHISEDGISRQDHIAEDGISRLDHSAEDGISGQVTESGKEKQENGSSTVASFQDLPEDLRINIWKLALPGPRLVEISFAAPRRCTNSHRSVPSILHVCSESRKEALKCYTVFPLGLISDPFRAVYVNLQIDILYFSVDAIDSMSGGPAEYWLGIEQLLNRVRFIAISHTEICQTPRDGLQERDNPDFDRFSNTVRNLVARVTKNCRTPGDAVQTVPFIRRFGKLEELSVVVIDDGTGEITDAHELDVWDEWQIGEVTGKEPIKRERSRLDWLFDCVANLYCHIRAVVASIEIGQTDWGLVHLIQWALIMMTREHGVLKDVKARIVTLDRAGKTISGLDKMPELQTRDKPE